MKEVRWNAEKDRELKRERNITFDQLINARFIGIERHPERLNQHLMLFEFKGYVWVVPYIDEGSYYFLKTAFPNRKYTKKYLGGK